MGPIIGRALPTGFPVPPVGTIARPEMGPHATPIAAPAAPAQDAEVAVIPLEADTGARRLLQLATTLDQSAVLEAAAREEFVETADDGWDRCRTAASTHRVRAPREHGAIVRRQVTDTSTETAADCGNTSGSHPRG